MYTAVRQMSLNLNSGFRIPLPWSLNHSMLLTINFLSIFLNENFKNLLSQQYCIINYSHTVVHYIPVTYLFYNWEFVPFEPLPISIFNLYACVAIKNILPLTFLCPCFSTFTVFTYSYSLPISHLKLWSGCPQNTHLERKLERNTSQRKM